MRRYWFSIVLPVFIAASIGTYYVGAATRDLPEFRIQTVAGNPMEAEHLVIDANTRIGDNMYHQIEIGTGGSLYGNRSFLSQIDNDFTNGNPDLVRLKKEHKGFMRGKISYGGFYMDDDKELVYAEAKSGPRDPSTGLNDYSISIAAQDLKSGKKKRFDAIMPGKQKYSYLYVYDVQMQDGLVKLLVSLAKESGAGRPAGIPAEIHLLTVDLDKEGISSDVTIAADTDKGAGKVERYAIRDTDTGVASPSDYALIAKSTVQSGKDPDGNYTEQPIGSQALVLDYKTGKLTPLPAEGETEGETGRFLSGGKLVTIAMATGGKLTVRSDDLANGRRGSSFDIPLALAGGTVSSMQKFVYGDRLYLLNHVNEDYELLIVNLTDGKIAYKGKLTVDGSPEQQRERLKPLTLYNFRLAY